MVSMKMSMPWINRDASLHLKIAMEAKATTAV